MNSWRPPSAAKRTVVAATVLMTAVLVEAAAAPGTAAAAGPNVLIIVTDDQRAGTLDVMPTTGRWFGRRGKAFPRAFATTPLCCPSRASIFTGLYAHNHGVKDNGGAGALPQELTLQRYLSEGGYTTAIVGKYLNSWPLWRNPPYFHRWATVRGNNPYNDAEFNLDCTVTTVPGYVTNVIARRAVRLLRQFERSDSQPWFLYIATTAPHLPATPAPSYAGTAVPPWPLNPAVNEADRSDKPVWVRARRASLEWVRTHRAEQLRTLMSVDDLMSNVAETLASLREGRRTIAFFLSDNGYLWGEHGLVEKRYPYTESIKIPLLLRWPGHVPAGSRDWRFATNVDIAPTILDAAALAPIVPMDGKSLLRTWTRERLFTEFFRDRQYPDLPRWASVRTSRFQYVEYSSEDGSNVVFREYYRLSRDPWQLTNVLHDGDSTNNPHTHWLHRLLKRYGACSGSSCP